MRKMLVVAAREYRAAVQTKAFLITLLIMPVMMGGSILVQWLLKDVRDTRDKHFAVIDRSPGGKLGAVIEIAIAEYNKRLEDPDTGQQVRPRFVVEKVDPSSDNPAKVAEQRLELSERTRKGELFGFLEIGAKVKEPFIPDLAAKKVEVDDAHAVRYQTNRPTFREFQVMAETAVTKAVQAERVGTKLNPAELAAILIPVPLTTKGLTARDSQTGEIEDGAEKGLLAPVFVPLGLLMLMFMVVLIGATPLMQGVIEEKMQRIAEVLLGSIQPVPLMAGKLLGMTGVSLTISGVYLGGAYWAAHRFGWAEYLPGELLAWFFTFQALSALMYGSLFIAIGAACTDMKEAQNLVWPVTLLAMLPMFVLGSVLQEPNGPVASGMSFFPFATPMLMVARMAIPPGIALWQPVVGVLLVLATTAVCVFAAGRIFRVGILMQGKGAKLSDLLRWVVRG